MLACAIRGAGKSGLLVCAGEASGPVWAGFAVVRMSDSDEMPLIIPS